MNTHADKTQENKSQSVANEVSQKQSGGESTFQFVDNRPEAIAQRKLQEMANNSPQVSQLRAFQDMANNSPQTKQAAQSQAMADNYTAQQPINRKENKTGLPDNLKTGIASMVQKSTIQFYRPAASEAYNTTASEEEKQPMFSENIIDPVLSNVGEPIDQYPKFQTRSEDVGVKPDLFVANDNTLAITRKNEPKEFYATENVVTSSNQALEAKGSKFQLTPKGHRLSIGGENLNMVAPQLRGVEAVEDAEIFGKFFTSICRDFATKVMNSTQAKHEAIFKTAAARGIATAGAPERREIDTGGSLTSSKVRNLGHSVVNKSRNEVLNTAFEMDDVANDNTAAGRSYGIELGAGRLQDKAQHLGINEFAAPEVGEGFAIYTNMADTNEQGQMLDYSAGDNPAARPNIWGYHYAGVVAKSIEGRVLGSDQDNHL